MDNSGNQVPRLRAKLDRTARNARASMGRYRSRRRENLRRGAYWMHQWAKWNAKAERIA